MQNLKGKAAVVIAASREIARAVARSFSQRGEKGYLTARNLDARKSIGPEIAASGGSAEAAKLDPLNETERGNFLKKVVADNGKLDVVFNGIAVDYTEMGGRPPTYGGYFRPIYGPKCKDMWFTIPYFEGSGKMCELEWG